MAKIGLVRVDDRLIHGQVITTWVGHTKSNRIVIVDNELQQNEYLATVYEMAAPNGVPVEIMSIDQAAAGWQKNELGEGTLLVLFKSIPSLKSAYDRGFHFGAAQIAGLAGGPGRKLVVKAIGISRDDAVMLKSLTENGVDIGFKSMPSEKHVTLESALSKNFKDLA